MRKLRNRKGMSLSETLITVAVFSVVLVAVTTGSVTSYRVYKQISKKADAETLLSTAVLAVSEDLYNASEVTTGSTKNEVSKTFYNVEYFYNDALNFNECFSNEISTDADGKTVISHLYWTADQTQDAAKIYPAVADKTQMQDLYAVIENNELWYDKDANCFMFTIAVYSIDDTEKPIAEQTAYAHSLLE